MKQKIAFILCLLFGLLFMDAGLNKFFTYMPIPDDLPEKMIKMNTVLMEIGWLLPLVAVAEIVGGILLIIPKFRTLGAIVIFPIMIGVVLTHLTAARQGLPLACILLTSNLWLVIENRAKYLRMIN